MNILFIGDIFGKPGRRAIRELLPVIIGRESINFVIANTENASGGKGITPKAADELFGARIDVMTAGNHIWEVESIYPYFKTHNILRPVNIEKEMPGRGWGVFACGDMKIGIVSLQGEIFMEDKGPKVRSPFKIIDGLLEEMGIAADFIVIDFHAEATSEKRALAWYLDGRIGALIGTHTHIQTSDEDILPGGTAYITDAGMTGPHESAIGLKKEMAIRRFLTGEQKGFKVAEGDVRLEGVILNIDKSSRKATEIRRVREYL